MNCGLKQILIIFDNYVFCKGYLTNNRLFIMGLRDPPISGSALGSLGALNR